MGNKLPNLKVFKYFEWDKFKIHYKLISAKKNDVNTKCTR